MTPAEELMRQCIEGRLVLPEAVVLPSLRSLSKLRDHGFEVMETVGCVVARRDGFTAAIFRFKDERRWVVVIAGRHERTVFGAYSTVDIVEQLPTIAEAFAQAEEFLAELKPILPRAVRSSLFVEGGRVIVALTTEWVFEEEFNAIKKAIDGATRMKDRLFALRVAVDAREDHNRFLSFFTGWKTEPLLWLSKEF